jgi:hypothetical protein
VIEALFHALQPSDQHVVLASQVVDLVAERVIESVHLVPQALLRSAHDSLDVRNEDLPMEPREYRDQIVHVGDPTPEPAAIGPEVL